MADQIIWTKSVLDGLVGVTLDRDDRENADIRLSVTTVDGQLVEVGLTGDDALRVAEELQNFAYDHRIVQAELEAEGIL